MAKRRARGGGAREVQPESRGRRGILPDARRPDLKRELPHGADAAGPDGAGAATPSCERPAGDLTPSRGRPAELRRDRPLCAEVLCVR